MAPRFLPPPPRRPSSYRSRDAPMQFEYTTPTSEEPPRKRTHYEAMDVDELPPVPPPTQEQQLVRAPTPPPAELDHSRSTSQEPEAALGPLAAAQRRDASFTFAVHHHHAPPTPMRRRRASPAVEIESESEEDEVEYRPKVRRRPKLQQQQGEVKTWKDAYVLLGYLHVLSLFALFSILLGLVALFLHAFITDLRSRLTLHSNRSTTLSLFCASEYVSNFCDSPHRAPAMATKCREWEECMVERAEEGRLRAIAQVTAEAVDAFVDAMSWRTIMFVVGLVAVTGYCSGAAIARFPAPRAAAPQQYSNDGGRLGGPTPAFYAQAQQQPVLMPSPMAGQGQFVFGEQGQKVLQDAGMGEGKGAWLNLPMT